MQLWTIRFRRIQFELSCFVFLFLYVFFVTYEAYMEIKRDDKMLLKTNSSEILLSCYYNNERDELPSVEDPNFSPKNKSIFFIDSTCRGKLTMLQACVAESAALANSDRSIYLLFSFPITEPLSKTYLKQLLSYPNVNAARIHIAKFAEDTVLESMLVNDLKRRKYPIEDASNILKIVTLYKWGGVILDHDMLVLRYFEDLPKNWVVKGNNGVSSGIFSFAKDDLGRKVTGELMKELAKSYYGPKVRQNSLEAILTRVLKRLCPNKPSKSGRCNGLSVFSEDLFYPIQIPEPNYFPQNDREEESRKKIDPYTYHLKNMDFGYYQSSEEWPSDALARIFCPGIFELKPNVKYI